MIERGEAILLGAHARSVDARAVEAAMSGQSISKVIQTTWND